MLLNFVFFSQLSQNNCSTMKNVECTFNLEYESFTETRKTADL